MYFFCLAKLCWGTPVAQTKVFLNFDTVLGIQPLSGAKINAGDAKFLILKTSFQSTEKNRVVGVIKPISLDPGIVAFCEAYGVRYNLNSQNRVSFDVWGIFFKSGSKNGPTRFK